MTKPSDVEQQNATEHAKAAERNRRLREQAITTGDLAHLLPDGAHAGVALLVERYLGMDEAQRAALLAAMEQTDS